jgi:hypothetical protein
VFRGKTLGIFVSGMAREFATWPRATECDWKTDRPLRNSMCDRNVVNAIPARKTEDNLERLTIFDREMMTNNRRWLRPYLARSRGNLIYKGSILSKNMLYIYIGCQ